jgi:hypothetical protein
LVASEFESGHLAFLKAVDAALPRLSVDESHAAVLNLNLTRGASLGGIVVYDDGGPAIGISVRIYRKDSTGTWKIYSSAGLGKDEPPSLTAHTDDRGRYYKPSLAPGIYTVEANLPDVTLVPDAILGSPNLHVEFTNQDALRVYHGGKYRLREASPIQLTEGQERLDVDLTIPTNGLCTLEGSVVSKADGRVVGQGTVRLLDPTDNEVVRDSTVQKDGSFVFRYIPPGSYLLEAEAHPGKDSAYRGPSYSTLKMPLLVESSLSNLTLALPASTH